MKYIKVLLQIGLGFGLFFAGISHLTTARAEFRAQVPTWLPLDADFVVIASGIVEISLGLGLLILWKQLPRKLIGLAAALFFIAIFPGNLSQWINGSQRIRPGRRPGSIHEVVLSTGVGCLGTHLHQRLSPTWAQENIASLQ